MGHRFLVDTNLPIDTEDPEVAAVLERFDVTVEGSTDLPLIGRRIAAHEPDIAFIPSADLHRIVRRGDRHYRGLAIPTSKFTGTVDYPSVMVVRRDDPADSLLDLRGASCGYINRSCTSSYFPPALLLNERGIRFDAFLDMRPVPAWQGQIDAVVSGAVRLTSVPEDVWRTEPGNADTTRIIGRYEPARPAVVVARHDLDRELRAALVEALCGWLPPWRSIYGCFKPYLDADLHHMFHELDALPADA
ncbi:MAG: PhnD/SsuA/transferrin family substrate-binding protein [Gluconacetobacter diazotrophicus]|nr:PhnD/SsuA/transferrin family substrate-binding protein [Gluconacetobacter diazotrophicus]